MKDTFSIQILRQEWLAGSRPEEDLCSHGRIRLVIGGTVIGDEGADLGISESALAMLRTLASDHTPEAPVAGRLICHGCGAILMMGCPIGIDWRVEHMASGGVRISDVVWYPETNEEDAQPYPGLFVQLSEADYAAEVVAFARRAGEMFTGVEKRFFDGFDKKQFHDFWQEYRTLLSKHCS